MCLYQSRCVFWIIPYQTRRIKSVAIINNQHGAITHLPPNKIICIESNEESALETGLILCCGCDADGYIAVVVQIMLCAQAANLLIIPHGVSDGEMFKTIIRNTYRAKGPSDDHYQIGENSTMVRVTTLIKSMFYPFNPQDTAARAIGMSKKDIKKTQTEYYMDWAQKRLIGTVSHGVIERVLNNYSLIDITASIDVSDQILKDTINVIDTAACDYPHNEGIDKCDHCIFFTQHREKMIEYISSAAARVYTHCFEPFICNLVDADPNALVVANECRMMIPLDTGCLHPIYKSIGTPPDVLCGTADMILSTTATTENGKFIPGSNKKLFVIDWKTTQKTPSVLESVFRPFKSDHNPIPLRFMDSPTSFSIMEPSTINQYYIQVSTYCLMANKLYGMLSVPLICVFKYTAAESTSLRGYKTTLYEPPFKSMTTAWHEILSSMCLN